MVNVIQVTLRGIFRDRIFQGIIVLALLFLGIPSAASLSMRQVTELSVTLSLSLISFILMVLAVFLGSTSIWKDIERRYAFSVLTLPLNRTTYLLGRFMGISIFLVLTSLLLGGIACLVIKLASSTYPPSRPVQWYIITASIMFETFKYILLVALAILLSTVSTSFFLPVFGTIGLYLAGNITQPVYDYLHSPSGMKTISPFTQKCALVVYYLLPNLSGFDLKVNAIYSIPLNQHGLFLTLLYGCTYVVMTLSAAAILFSRREMK